ncbi:hypothetical protein EYY60_14945 [Flavobacterium zhairuonense]|uniref:hypothetical protein n=1 Tax=Flavobacterium zhairuonense TaxID=2493631 RepID=UPI0013C2B1F8|nr:hypothetical protein [Flavobacterium zhairuonense]KAF2508425.1 hypothetical protein EYY60_14945 [Flavobacterium zhairuonense]
MFNIFKKKIKSSDTDISSNPSILFDTSISCDKLSVYNIFLGDSANKINIENIATTTMEKLPVNATASSWCDNKTFYYIDNEEIEYKLVDRINTVLNNSGWIHLKNGIKYRVLDKIVVEFAIHGEFLNFYKNIPKNDIENKFGKADKVIENWENYDGTLFNTDYIYSERKIRIYFQDWDKEINGINIGESLKSYE